MIVWMGEQVRFGQDGLIAIGDAGAEYTTGE
jgi:hypothetical protein